MEISDWQTYFSIVIQKFPKAFKNGHSVFILGILKCLWWPMGSMGLMFLACHKKSYLICDELTNFRIFTQPIPNFFSTYKTETFKQGRDSCLKINKYSKFLTSRFRQIAFLMTCQQYKVASWSSDKHALEICNFA